jgi:hypothetical protein
MCNIQCTMYNTRWGFVVGFASLIMSSLVMSYHPNLQQCIPDCWSRWNADLLYSRSQNSSYRYLVRFRQRLRDVYGQSTCYNHPEVWDYTLLDQSDTKLCPTHSPTAPQCISIVQRIHWSDWWAASKSTLIGTSELHSASKVSSTPYWVKSSFQLLPDQACHSRTAPPLRAIWGSQSHKFLLWSR